MANKHMIADNCIAKEDALFGTEQRGDLVPPSEQARTSRGYNDYFRSLLSKMLDLPVCDYRQGIHMIQICAGNAVFRCTEK